MDKFSFTPDGVFSDTAAYGDPQSETEVREQLSRPHKQIETYINNTLIPAINIGNNNIQSQIDDTLTPAIEARMKIATYDTDADGIVDNAEKVNGHTVESDVPSGAKFTDTTYQQASASVTGIAKMYGSTGTATDGSMTQKAITDAIVNAAFKGVTIDSAMSDTSKNPVQNNTIKAYVDGQIAAKETEIATNKSNIATNTSDIATNKTNIEANAAAIQSTTKTVTLSASSWSSGSYTITDALITATSNQEIIPGLDITSDQLKALQKAMIVDGGQSAGSLTLKALGTVPTVDIPIRVIYRGVK